MTTPSADALRIPWNAENSYPFYDAAAAAQRRVQRRRHGSAARGVK